MGRSCSETGGIEDDERSRGLLVSIAHDGHSREALVILDFQCELVDRILGGDSEVVANMGLAAMRARWLGSPVVYVNLEFREGHPEVSDRNRSFSRLKSEGRLTRGTPGTTIVPTLSPQSADIVLARRRRSAFVGTELELLTRSLRIETIVMGGITTSGVVLATLSSAVDRDYNLVVLEDCCYDTDVSVHSVLVEKIFPRYAEVTTVAAWSKE